MFTSSSLVLTISLFIYCEAAYVDTLPKCSIKDTECLKGVYQYIIKTVGNDGIAELGIAPLDPMEIKDLSFTILNAVNIYIKDGSAKGMANCVFHNFDIDWEKEKAYLNIACDDLSLKSRFEISGENKELQSIFGSNNLNGDGKIKIKLNKLNLKAEISLFVTKKDGEIYINVSNKNIKYTYEVDGAHFVTEKVNIANNDISQIVSSYLNDNWKVVMNQFGVTFMDKALELFIGLVGNASEKIPAKNYITEDITSYIKH